MKGMQENTQGAKKNNARYIYGLKDSDNTVFYIGMSNNPKRRLSDHIRATIMNKHSAKYEKFKKHLPFSLIILEECNESNWEEREVYFIAQYPSAYNVSIGGLEWKDNVKKIRRTKQYNGGELPNIVLSPLTKRFGLYDPKSASTIKIVNNGKA